MIILTHTLYNALITTQILLLLSENQFNRSCTLPQECWRVLYRDNASKNIYNFSSTRDSRFSSVRNASSIKMHYLHLFNKTLKRNMSAEGRQASRASVRVIAPRSWIIWMTKLHWSAAKAILPLAARDFYFSDF